MNPTNKKAPGARGVQQQIRPFAVQLKNGVSAQRVERPVAPPAYRPQPRSLQPARPRAVPTAPPVYKPQPAHAAAQAKAYARPPLANAPKTAPAHPAAPPVYRPQPLPRVLQRKPAHVVAAQANAAVARHVTPQPPPVYRPIPVPRVLQTKTVCRPESAAACAQLKGVARVAPTAYSPAAQPRPPHAHTPWAPLPCAPSRPAVVIQRMRSESESDEEPETKSTKSTKTTKRKTVVELKPRITKKTKKEEEEPSFFDGYNKEVTKAVKKGKVRITQNVHDPEEDEEPTSSQKAVIEMQLGEIKKTKKLPTNRDNIGGIGENDYKRSLKTQRIDFIDLNSVKNKNFDGLDFIIADKAKPFVQNKLHLTVSNTTYKSEFDNAEGDAEKFLKWLLLREGEKQKKFRKKLKAFANLHDIGPLKTLVQYYEDDGNLLDQTFETVNEDIVSHVASHIQYPVPTDIAEKYKKKKEYKNIVSPMSHNTDWYTATHSKCSYRECKTMTKQERQDLEDGDFKG